jgi:tetratricopeptide (TPR) repeat protein
MQFVPQCSQTRRHGVWVPAFAGTTWYVGILFASILWTLLPHGAFAATTEPAKDPQIDPAPCLAAVTANDDDKIVAVCAGLVDGDKTQKADRLRALLARAGAYDRKDQIDRAIADYDAALRLDPTLADIFNARGELWRRKGDRPRALADFGAALKLNSQHEAARANYKSLALELERLGAQMAIKKRSNPPLK